MKNNKILAVALSAGLVLGGGLVNNAEAAEPNEDNWYPTTESEDWEALAADLDAQQGANEGEAPYQPELGDVDNTVGNDPDYPINELENLDNEDEETSGKKVTIDEWNLNNAKDEAIQELKDAGITSDFLLNQIRNAKTIEGVESLKQEILKSHADSTKGKQDEDKKEEVELKGTFHFPTGDQEAKFVGEDGKAAYGQLRDYAYSFENKFGEPAIYMNPDGSYDVSYPDYNEQPVENKEVELKGRFHFPDGTQEAKFKAENGSKAYGQLYDYAYSFEDEFGEPSIMKRDDGTYDIYYDKYEGPSEKEDFTITVNVFKPFAKESYVTATFDGDRYGNDYDKAQADVWRWADAQSGVRNYRAEIVDKYTINIYELEDLDKDDSNDDDVIPFPIPVPDDDKDDDGNVIPPYKPDPTPSPLPTPDPDDDKETPVVDDDDKAPEEDNEYIDKLIKDLDDISKEMEEAIKLVDEDEADKDEDKDPSKDDDDNKKPAKDNEDDDKAANKDNCEKVVAVKDVVREDKDAVKVPARKSTVAHNNPKTGVVGLSAAAGALAVSMAGIVATRKKND